MYKLYAKRNSSTVERYLEKYEEWVDSAARLLDDGFMVLVDEENNKYAIHNNKGDVIIVTEQTGKEKKQWLS